MKFFNENFIQYKSQKWMVSLVPINLVIPERLISSDILINQILLYTRACGNGRKENEWFSHFPCSSGKCECMWVKKLIENFGYAQKIKKILVFVAFNLHNKYYNLCKKTG